MGFVYTPPPTTIGRIYVFVIVNESLGRGGSLTAEEVVDDPAKKVKEIQFFVIKKGKKRKYRFVIFFTLFYIITIIIIKNKF